MRLHRSRLDRGVNFTSLSSHISQSWKETTSSCHDQWKLGTRSSRQERNKRIKRKKTPTQGSFCGKRFMARSDFINIALAGKTLAYKTSPVNRLTEMARAVIGRHNA